MRRAFRYGWSAHGGWVRSFGGSESNHTHLLFKIAGRGSLKLRDVAREELAMYLELLPMCARIGVHASPIDFSVMLQVSCGLADVRATVDILMHFRAFEVDEPWIFRRIVSPLRFLLEHCFDTRERTTAAADGLLVLATMERVGLPPTRIRH